MLETIKNLKRTEGNFYLRPDEFFSMLNDIEDEVNAKYVERPSSRTKAAIQSELTTIESIVLRLFNNYSTTQEYDVESKTFNTTLIWNMNTMEMFREEFVQAGISIPQFELPKEEKESSEFLEEDAENIENEPILSK